MADILRKRDALHMPADLKKFSRSMEAHANIAPQCFGCRRLSSSLTCLVGENIDALAERYLVPHPGDTPNTPLTDLCPSFVPLRKP